MVQPEEEILESEESDVGIKDSIGTFTWTDGEHSWVITASAAKPSRQPFQCVGNAGCYLRSPGISAKTLRENGPFDVWQCHCGFVHQTGGWDPIFLSDHKAHQVLQPEKHCYFSCTHSGMLQTSRPIVYRLRARRSDGVLDRLQSPGVSVLPMAYTMDRPLCYVPEWESSTLCVPLPWPMGDLHGCHVDPEDWDGNAIHLPTIQDDASSVSQLRQPHLTTKTLYFCHHSRWRHHGCQSSRS